MIAADRNSATSLGDSSLSDDRVKLLDHVEDFDMMASTDDLWLSDDHPLPTDHTFVESFQSPSGLKTPAIIGGILIGGMMCFSNMYFGLQTGWVTLGSIQTSLLGFGFFKVLLQRSQFNIADNVLLQAAGVATCTMPLAGGLVGIVPALTMLTESDRVGGGIVLNWWKLTIFTLSLAYFGVFFAVPLRKYMIIKEKLQFPSGTLTAKMISMFHQLDSSEKDEDAILWKRTIKFFIITVVISSTYDLASYFIPVLHNIPIFSLVGLPIATQFYWVWTPAPSYIGQGMIMGPRTCFSMFLGSILGWAILGPLAKTMEWAPGDIDSWENGAKGWILWVSLALMLADSTSSLLIVTFTSFKSLYYSENTEDEDTEPKERRVPSKVWIIGLGLTVIISSGAIWGVFYQDMDWYHPLMGIIFSLFIALLGVRALGETDLNPVSGIGKLSQVLFSLIAPGNIVANLIAGGIAEAGAMQAGDLVQDLKTAYLLKVSPRSIFQVQIIGSFFSVLFSVLAYILYNYAYTIPGPELPAPSAMVWINMAHITNGGELATNVFWFALTLGFLGFSLPILSEIFPKQKRYFPSAIAVAVGMYLTPNWTIPRVMGAIIQMVWSRKWPISYDNYMIVVASGLFLGEGVFSIIVAVLSALKVPIISCVGCTAQFCSCANNVTA
eukprot:TRINITY_DN11794_c0_g1_i1.p1 TRINITY_DN11794_c0_g1~~TRINITY_DN11794_c0_g1_i1.p1  ORF type:complete len:666 (+),score=103.36 TRINITY_DN11794_c0_g1_i1:162-2159(+)